MTLRSVTSVLVGFLAATCTGEVTTLDGCTFEHSDGLTAYDGNRNVPAGTVVPHGTTLTYHCEPLGSRSLWGAENTTCNDGRWNRKFPLCVSLPKEIPRMDVKAPGLVVGPRGVVYVEPHTRISVGCSHKARYEVQALLKRIRKTWPGTGGRLTRMSLAFALQDGERETVKCITTDNAENSVQLVGRRLHRCLLLEESRGMTIRYSGTKAAEISCSPNYVLRGPRFVQCLPLGEWDSKPLCLPLDGVPLAPGALVRVSDTSEGGKQALMNSCTVEDTIFQFAHAFVGLQKVEDIRHISDGAAAVFHCEPVGLTTGRPVSVTCKNGNWTWADSDTPVSTPLCRPLGEGDIAIKVVGDYTVGPRGVVFVKPGRRLHLTCAFGMETSKNQTTWVLRQSMSGNGGGTRVRHVRGHRLSISMETSEEVECECRVLSRRRKIKIRGEGYDFCKEPRRPHGLHVLYRNGSKVGFACEGNMTLNGQTEIECTEAGQWNFPPPYCTEPATSVTQHIPPQPYKRTTVEPETTGTKRSTIPAPPAGGSTSGTDHTKGTVTCPAANFYKSVGPLVILHNGQRNVSFVEHIPAGSALDVTCGCPESIAVGDSSVVRCQQDGTWSFAANLRCARGCPNFAVGDSSLIIEGLKESYELGDSITLDCPKGKRLEPRVERIICQEISWAPNALPKCVPEEREDDKRKSEKGVFSRRQRVHRWG